jgi:membrane-associated protein
MNVKIYTLYSAIGGVIWITSVTVAGYFLGQIGFIRDNLDLIVIAAVVVVICASAFPAVAHWVASRRAKQAAKGDNPGPGTPTIEPAAE